MLEKETKSPFWFRAHSAKWNQNTHRCIYRCVYSFQTFLKSFIFMQRPSCSSQLWVEKGTFTISPTTRQIYDRINLMANNDWQKHCPSEYLNYSRLVSWFDLMVTRKHLILWSQSSQENNCARAYFLIKLQVSACNFIKKGTLAQVFSCELREVSINTFSYKTPQVAASILTKSLLKNEINLWLFLVLSIHW